MWAKPHLPRRGFTLPEILISTGILSLVLVACYALIVFAIRWNAKMGDTVDTYQRALNASTRISYDLGAGSASTFIYYPDDPLIIDEPGFVVASARPETGPFQLDSSGRLLMQRWIVYQLVGETLYRNEIPIDPPLSRGELMDAVPEPDYVTLRDSLSTPGQIQAENLKEFKVEGGGSADYVLELEGKKTDEIDPTKKVNTIRIEGRVNFRS